MCVEETVLMEPEGFGERMWKQGEKNIKHL